MKRSFIHVTISLLIILGLFGASISSAAAHGTPIVQAQTIGGTSIYIPLIANRSPAQTVFGIQADSLQPGSQTEYLGGANPTWVRGLNISWAAFEPTRGAQNWSSLASFEQELNLIRSKGGTAIVTISNTPSWAQKVAGYACGPIAEQYFGDFSRFVSTIVSHYSSVNYTVRYWEIWNEPDIQPGLVSGNSPFGCWGDANDPYYGGGYYGKMLKAVYPAVKSADPSAQLLVGGLLLDCDPNSPAARANASNPGCQTSRFLEGILVEGAGSSFDGVSFHAYDYYGGVEGQYSNANWGASFANGPVLIAKAAYLQQLLNQYGVTGKYLMNTELAVLQCSLSVATCPYDQPFENTKAAYVGISYASAMAIGLRANVWYSLVGQWRNSGLLDQSNGQPVSAYTAFQFANKEIGNATYHGAIGRYPGVKGYEFVSGNKKIWVLWAPGGNTPTDLGWVPAAIYDNLGNPITPGSSLTIGYAPVFIEWLL